MLGAFIFFENGVAAFKPELALLDGLHVSLLKAFERPQTWAILQRAILTFIRIGNFKHRGPLPDIPAFLSGRFVDVRHTFVNSDNFRADMRNSWSIEPFNARKPRKGLYVAW